MFLLKKHNKKTDIKKYDTLPKAIDEFFYLAVNRWVGIDAVLSVTANKNKIGILL